MQTLQTQTPTLKINENWIHGIGGVSLSQTGEQERRFVPSCWGRKTLPMGVFNRDRDIPNPSHYRNKSSKVFVVSSRQGLYRYENATIYTG